MQLMSADDDVVLVETGADQRWIGRDEVRRNIQLDYDAVAGDIRSDHVYHVARHGDTAWLVGELEMAMDFKGRQMRLQDLRFTAIAKRADDGWRWSCLQVGLLDPQKGPDEQWNTWTVHERLGGAVSWAWANQAHSRPLGTTLGEVGRTGRPCHRAPRMASDARPHWRWPARARQLQSTTSATRRQPRKLLVSYATQVDARNDQGDVGDPDQAAQLVSETIEAFGGLHVVVNNAGISVDQLDIRFRTGLVDRDDADELRKRRECHSCCDGALSREREKA